MKRSSIIRTIIAALFIMIVLTLWLGIRHWRMERSGAFDSETWTWKDSAPDWQMNLRQDTVPDTETRKQVEKIHLPDIGSATIFVDIEMVTKDPTIIALLLQGLKESKIPDPMPTNRVDHVTLKLKNGKSVGPFGFSIEREVDAFSPAFIKGLRALGIEVPLKK